MQLGTIASLRDMEEFVLQVGMVPLFRGDIPGFSVEENLRPGMDFFAGEDNPWYWREAIAEGGKIAYGKFFSGKAGFVRLDLLPHLANYRRNGYDFEGRYEEGLASRKEKEIIDAIERFGPIMTGPLKRACGYHKGGNTGFEGVITRLQMQTYVIVCGFDYAKDKFGKPYGWSISRYTTPEMQFGASFFESAYETEPEYSYNILLEHLQGVAPEATQAQLKCFLG